MAITNEILDKHDHHIARAVTNEPLTSVLAATLILITSPVLVQTYLSGVPHAPSARHHITVVDRRAYATMRLLRTRPHHFLLQFLDDLLAPFVIAVSRLTTPDAPRAAQIETLSNADLLGEILSHCDADGLEKAMSVSRAWRTCGSWGVKAQTTSNQNMHAKLIL